MASISAVKLDLPDIYEWCTEFKEPRAPLQGYSAVYTRAVPGTINPDTDLITLFTDADDPGQTPNLEAQNILEFCRNVRSSDAFHQNPPKRLAAVVHESGSTGRSRGGNYPLTATQLYETLSIPRFGAACRTSGLTGDTTVAQHGKLPTKRVPYLTKQLIDAEKRLVLVVNLDEWVVWALAATVCSIEARALRLFISDHLALKTGVNAKIPASVPHTFELSFHLPFYALRDASKGGPFHDFGQMRNLLNIEFMHDTFQDSTVSPSSEYLYQAGSSCLVTGQDSRIWTAYTFIDGCNEYEDGGILESYAAQKEELGNVFDMFDPATGEPLAWPAITPRELFLVILHVRSEQAAREWCHTISQILAKYRSTRDSFDTSLAPSWATATGYNHGKEVRSKVKRYFRWAISVIKLLETLRGCLDECAHVWGIFTSGEIHYFFAPEKDWDMTSTPNHRMASITRSFNQMAMLSRKLDTINVGLKNTINELGHHLAYENNDAAILQMATAKDVKILTWVTFHSLPFMLVAGFMSTRAEILPLPETPATLILSLIAIEVVIWTLLDRFTNGRYMAMVKASSQVVYRWARYAVYYEGGVEPAEQA